MAPAVPLAADYVILLIKHPPGQSTEYLQLCDNHRRDLVLRGGFGSPPGNAGGVELARPSFSLAARQPLAAQIRTHHIARCGEHPRELANAVAVPS